MRGFIFLVLVVTRAMPTSVAGDRARGVELLSHASKQTDLWAVDASPVTSPAAHFQERPSGHLPASLGRSWALPQGVEAPEYSAILVRVDNREWRANSLGFVPLRIGQAESALNFRDLLVLHANEGVKRLSRRKVGSYQAECVETKSLTSPGREFCFEQATGHLLQVSDRDLRYELGNYVSFGTKTFPTTIRVKEYGEPAAEVTIEELASVSSPDPALFLPPHGAVEWPLCQTPGSLHPPKALEQPRPRYPPGARMIGQGGKVEVSAVIGTDGRLRNIAVIRSAGPALDEAALESLRTWRYQPATCDGKPIPVEATTSITFNLAPH